MKPLKLISLLLLLTFADASFAQLKRANKYYSNYDYVKAITLYKKVIRKNTNTEALEKLANSYRFIKNYQQAELAYAQLMKQPDFDPIDHFYYGMVLKSNNKIDEAKEQFKIYANAAPGNKKAELSVRSCDDIKLWINNVQQFDVKPVLNINTKYAEFCPTFYKDLLVFSSDRNTDWVNQSKYSWNDHPFLNIYHSKISNDKNGQPFSFKKIKLFVWPINSGGHDGPACFSVERNLSTIYFTHVNSINKKDPAFINRAKIYTSTYYPRKWATKKEFKYNSDLYSVAHPSISSDGKFLFFSSDMPGGSGGMDIYCCKKDGDGWAPPQNLGESINTSGDEVFPYIRKDGTLYFSSDGLSGFGGLDIFSATKTGDIFSNVKNLGRPLNSSTDDFGIVFNDDNTKGLFSSDREGGKGSDDIYSFTAFNKFLTVSGKILLSQNIKDPVKNAKVTLLTEEGNIVNITTTDSTGFFKFDNLDPDKKYMLKLDENDPELINKKRYYMADDKGKIVGVTVINDKGGKFVFQNLPTDANSLTEIPEEDVTIAGNLLFGESPSKPLANTKVNLVNDKGEIVQSTTTNTFGAFVFSNLPPDQNFVVKVDENDTQLDPNTKVIITNKSGKEIQTTMAGAKGGFRFSFLAADKNKLQAMVVEDTELRFDFKGKLTSDQNVPVVNSIVNLVNEKSEILKTTKTDANGNFVFINLPADKNTLIALDENDPQIKTLNKIYLVNDKGVIVKEFTRTNGKFRFTILPSEQNKLGHMYVDDPWLQVLQFKNESKKDSLTIVENVYYNYAEYKILPEAQKALDKVITVMKNDPALIIELSSHTDSRSTFEYNMKLSQQRAKAAVDYIIAGGIAKNRISGKGYGESKLINKCADGVECTEEEHAKNRRTEFKILRKQK